MKYLFIPSCEVLKNSLEGTTTEKRLTQGLKMWNKGVYDVVVVSGGVFLPPEIQTIPAAKLMKEWLIRKGVPSSKVIAEARSRDTFENILFSLQLMKDPVPKITVVTHWQHAIRCKLAFLAYRHHKIDVKLIPMWYWIGLKNFVLEWGMLAVHIFDPLGKGIIPQRNRKSRTFSVFPTASLTKT